MEQDEHDLALADSCAVALASLDRRACARVQMRDANTILEQLLLPISFPWSQCKDMLYKPLPRDIDEMSIIMHGEDEHSVVELNSETVRALATANIPDNIHISTSRTEDPGVLELRTYTKPTASRIRTIKRICSMGVHAPKHEESMMHGERSLQMYHEVQLKKRRREEINEKNTIKKLISFRVGCTSSRSTVFSQSELSNDPLFLQATYPKHIQDGTKKFGLEAFEEGTMYGSYNGRRLPPKSSVMNDPSSKNRFFVGRTRLVWTEKEQSGSKSQRSPYGSILTRQRLEASTIKRPLSVKVGVRINGVLVSVRQSQETALDVEPMITSESTYSHSMKSVNDALDLACSLEKQLNNAVANQSNEIYAPRDYSQSSLNVPKFLTEVAQGSTSCLEQQNQQRWNAVDVIRTPISIQRELWLYRSDSVKKEANKSSCVWYRLRGKGEKVDPTVDAESELAELLRDGIKLQYQSKLKLKIEIVPPRFDCLPTEDGLIHVTCTLPGKIVLINEDVCNEISSDRATTDSTNISTPVTLSVLLNVLASETDRCPVCWNYRQGNPICNICKYGNDLPMNAKGKWLNIIGSLWSKVNSLAPEWMHTTEESNCTYSDKMKWYSDKSVCHLCTTGTMGSVTVSSCAAEGCDVRFHPICAIIASATNEVQYSNGTEDTSHESNGRRYKPGNSRNYKNNDTFLCTQYTQYLVETSFVSAHKTTTSIPFRNKKLNIKSPPNNRDGKNRSDSNQPKILNGTKVITATSTSTTQPKASPTATGTLRERNTICSSNVAEVTVPITFCPYHNPKRRPEHYGLYPQSCYFNHDTIRIPPQRDYTKSILDTASAEIE